jgi:hypothetical protein
VYNFDFGDEWLSTVGKWVLKLAARLGATASLGVRIQPYLRIQETGDTDKEWTTHSYPAKTMNTKII